MFGFIKTNIRPKTQLGGEIFRAQKRKRLIITTVFGIIAFLLLNALLYSMTQL